MIDELVEGFTVWFFTYGWWVTPTITVTWIVYLLLERVKAFGRPFPGLGDLKARIREVNGLWYGQVFMPTSIDGQSLNDWEWRPIRPNPFQVAYTDHAACIQAAEEEIASIKGYAYLHLTLNDPEGWVALNVEHVVARVPSKNERCPVHGDHCPNQDEPDELSAEDRAKMT